MFTRRIVIDTVDKVQNLVRAATAAPFEVDIMDKNFTVNAKSIMGLFSIDRSEPITVSIGADEDSEESKAFLEQICTYLV